MDSTVTYKCLGCGAGLLFDAEKQTFACEFCLSEFTEEELKASERQDDPKDYKSEVDEYICSSCGAEVVADKNTAATFCYYCHNPVVLKGNVSGEFKPTKIIPFKLSKEEAKAEFLRYASKKKFIPRDYFTPQHFDKISGVYYPFWVVDADTDSSMNARGKIIRSWRAGDYRYTETSTYDVSRRGRIHFEDVSSSAISGEDKAMLEGILPYPIEEYKDFSMPYLQGFLAKKRDLKREDLYTDVKGKMNGYATEVLRQTVGHYDAFDVRNTDVSILSSHWEYSLLPVWVLTYLKKGKTKGKDKTYVYAMNGHSGKIYGEFPVSIWKLLFLGGGIFIGVFLLMLLIGYNFFI